MVLRHLRSFAAVAEEGSVARAASRLRIAQPALSRQIQSLERVVGTPVFSRARRGVELTRAGSVLLRGVEELLASVDRSVRRTRLAHQGKLGTRRVALGRIAVHNKHVGRALAQLHGRYPDVRLVVSEQSSLDHAALLRSGAVDIGIGVHGSARETGIRHEVLQADAVDRVLLPATHPLAQASVIEPRQLAGERLLMLRGPTLMGFTDLFDALHDLGFKEWDEYEWPETVYSMVAAGRGFTTHVRSIDPTPPGTVGVPLKGLNVPLNIVVRWNENDASRLTANIVAQLRAGASTNGNAEHAASAQREESEASETRAQEDVSALDLPEFELRQLRSFVVTMEEGSLSAAAPRLHLTQSGLSRQIRVLERELDIPLLQRAAHGVRATAAGDVFNEEARAILAHVDDVVAQARAVLRGIVGRCRIGAVPTEVMGDLLVATLRRVHGSFPEIAVEVREIVSTLQVSALRDRQIDIALAVAYPGLVDDPTIDMTLLSDDSVDSALLASSHPLAGRSSIKPSELAGEPFVFVSRGVVPKMYDTVMESFGRLGLVPRMNEPVQGPRAIWRLVADGMGWTVGNRAMREKPLPGLVAIPIDGFNVQTGIALLWRRSESSPTVQAVLEAFRKQA